MGGWSTLAFSSKLCDPAARRCLVKVDVQACFAAYNPFRLAELLNPVIQELTGRSLSSFPIEIVDGLNTRCYFMQNGHYLIPLPEKHPDEGEEDYDIAKHVHELLCAVGRFVWSTTEERTLQQSFCHLEESYLARPENKRQVLGLDAEFQRLERYHAADDAINGAQGWLFALKAIQRLTELYPDDGNIQDIRYIAWCDVLDYMSPSPLLVMRLAETSDTDATTLLEIARDPVALAKELLRPTAAPGAGWLKSAKAIRRLLVQRWHLMTPPNINELRFNEDELEKTIPWHRQGLETFLQDPKFDTRAAYQRLQQALKQVEGQA